MKRLLPFAFCLLLSAFALPALAQKTDPGPICKDCDVAVAPKDIDPYIEKFAADLSGFEDSYVKQYGTYAQMLSPFVTVPTDGKADLPTDVLKSPTSGVSADTIWQATGLDAFPATVRIDVYDGPKGKGYVLVFESKFNGLLYTKTKNVGPELYRDSDWTVMP